MSNLLPTTLGRERTCHIQCVQVTLFVSNKTPHLSIPVLLKVPIHRLIDYHTDEGGFPIW